MAISDPIPHCAYCHLPIFINNWTYFVRFVCGHIAHAECFILSPVTTPPHQCGTCGQVHTIDELIFFK
jgi:hypothetical protein